MRFSGGGRGGGVPMTDRVYAVLPYLMPLLDALTYGRFVFAALPAAVSGVILGVLGPLFALYRGTPFVAFGVFLAIYVFVVRNANVSRFVRFNAYQALLLDIALIIPQLFSALRLGVGVPPQVVEILCSSVFWAILLAVIYAVSTNLRGKLPDQIPGVSASVYSQIGPM